MSNSKAPPLPRGWTKSVRAAVLHVIALAQFSLACAEAQVARRPARRRRLRAANRKPRMEPRAKWPRGSPCAEPQARVKGKCGTKLVLHVRLHAGRHLLPVVTRRKVA